MPGPYAQCSAISSTGAEIFWTAVKKHLDRINSSCAIDPAMKNRHPALGLVHEMIHAYHSATGRNMRVRNGGGNLEEVITTGLPPYQYEEFSDNRFRTEMGPDVALRMKY